MNLSDSVKQYYLANNRLLPKAKRFHLASRLTAWQGDESAKEILRQLKGYMVGDDTAGTLRRLINLSVRRVYGLSLRSKYFEKYPELFGIHEALFRVRHLQEVYGIDARGSLLELVSQDKLDKIYTKLAADYEAIRILSRFAVDYIALYEILFDKPSRMDRSRILEQKNDYDLGDPMQLHLFIYLITHVIIADTNFYVREIPADRLEGYRQMLDELDAILSERQNIKLDNKFEYLVAARICQEPAALAHKIERQAQDSVSEQGIFITDGSLPKESKMNTFSGSEHRNVLYIMGSSDYKPNSQRV